MKPETNRKERAMSISWDDPELDELADELEVADVAILDIDPEELREMEADAALRVRSHGLGEDDRDPEDDW